MCGSWDSALDATAKEELGSSHNNRGMPDAINLLSEQHGGDDCVCMHGADMVAGGASRARGRSCMTISIIRAQGTTVKRMHISLRCTTQKKRSPTSGHALCQIIFVDLDLVFCLRHSDEKKYVISILSDAVLEDRYGFCVTHLNTTAHRSLLPVYVIQKLIHDAMVQTVT